MDKETVEKMWTLLVDYLPAKERQTAADHLASELVDVMEEVDLLYLSGVDNYMKRAIAEHIELEEYEEDFE